MCILICEVPVINHCLILAGVSHIICSLVTSSTKCLVAGSRFAVYNKWSTYWRNCAVENSEGVGGCSAVFRVVHTCSK